MAPWVIPVALAGTQMAYNEFVEKPRVEQMNKRQAQAAATQTQFSPWTGMGKGEAQYQMPQSSIGAGLQGAMSGASFAQAYDAAQSQKSLQDAQKNYLNAQVADAGGLNSPWIDKSSGAKSYAQPGSYDEAYRISGWRR
jgi:hypothetical protein